MTALLLHLGTLLGAALVILLSTQILRARRAPSATWGWLLFMLALPWLAIPFYLGFGSRKLPSVGADAGQGAPSPVTGVDTSELTALELVALRDGVANPIPGNRITLHADGRQALQALMKLIDGATKRLDLCVFLMADDTVGRQVANALIEATRRGVKVRLLLDGLGSFLFAWRRFRALEKAGLQIATFIPLIHRPFRGRNNLRNHRKIVIADGARAWTGGRNLADEYFLAERRWIDLSYLVEGPVVAQLSSIFTADWQFATGQTVKAARQSKAIGTLNVQVIRSGPDTRGEPLHDLILAALWQANKSITLVTPYFVPDSNIQRALCLAAMRGIAVNLIIPRRSNHRLADVARNRYLRELTQMGGTVTLVEHAMVHAKAIVIDRNVTFIGSANLDLRSLFLNFETVCLVRDEHFTSELQLWISHLKRHSTVHAPCAASRMREALEGLVLLLAYQL